MSALCWITSYLGIVISFVGEGYFNAAGADPAADIGEDHNPKPHLLFLVLSVALGLGPAVQVFGTDYPSPDGTALRDYVHVSDLAQAQLLALEYLLDGGGSITVNLGSGKGISVRLVIESVEKTTGRKVSVRYAPRRPGDPSILVADPKRPRNVLGWVPEQSDHSTIIADAWRWHSNHLAKRRA